MALQLLIAANQPNVPASLRATAVSIANYAIEISNKAIAEAKNEPLTPVVTAPSVPLGAVTPPVLPATAPVLPEPVKPEPIIVSTPQPMPINKSDITIEFTRGVAFDSAPYGTYNFIIGILNSEGKYVKDAIISMDAPDHKYAEINKYVPDFKGDPKAYALVNAGPRAANGMSLASWQDKNTPSSQFEKFTTSWEYVPMATGTKFITFTSNNLSKSITIEVK